MLSELGDPFCSAQRFDSPGQLCLGVSPAYRACVDPQVLCVLGHFHLDASLGKFGRDLIGHVLAAGDHCGFAGSLQAFLSKILD